MKAVGVDGGRAECRTDHRVYVWLDLDDKNTLNMLVKGHRFG